MKEEAVKEVRLRKRKWKEDMLVSTVAKRKVRFYVVRYYLSCERPAMTGLNRAREPANHRTSFLLNIE